MRKTSEKLANTSVFKTNMEMRKQEYMERKRQRTSATKIGEYMQEIFEKLLHTFEYTPFKSRITVTDEEIIT